MLVTGSLMVSQWTKFQTIEIPLANFNACKFGGKQRYRINQTKPKQYPNKN